MFTYAVNSTHFQCLSTQNERHFIMQVVCEATQCSDNNVQVAALQNLVKIMSLYYQYMEAYMGPALFAVREINFVSIENNVIIIIFLPPSSPSLLLPPPLLSLPLSLCPLVPHSVTPSLLSLPSLASSLPFPLPYIIRSL